MSAIEASARAHPRRRRAEAAPPWKVWTALWIVYIVWGSTYLAIALMVETIPPLLGAGFRFIAVGLILLPILAFRRGASVWRPTRNELLSRRLRRPDAAGRQRRHLRRREDRARPASPRCWWPPSRCG